jgi:hypothetical protein
MGPPPGVQGPGPPLRARMTFAPTKMTAAMTMTMMAVRATPKGDDPKKLKKPMASSRTEVACARLR